MEQSAAGWMLGSHTCRWVQCDQTADCTKRYMYRYIVCVYVCRSFLCSRKIHVLVWLLLYGKYRDIE